MPPRAKFTREEIIAAALELVRENGFDVLTARALGGKLGSSPRPIFTVFRSMDEVQEEVLNAARALYNGYVKEALASENSHPFKCVGQQYIRFAICESKLFQLLFMREQREMRGIRSVLPVIEENYEDILRSIEKEYGFDRCDAQELYQHLWIYTHGIATLCATKMCAFTGDDISRMLTEVFQSLLRQYRGGVGS